MARGRTSMRLLMLALLPAAGCTSVQQRPFELWPPRSSATPTTVFVADGAGNYQLFSKALRNVVKQDSKAIDVVTHEWSHGKYRVLADYLHHEHARAEGRKLAEQVLAYRAELPRRVIHLAGHSAGANVVLAALEHLPADCVSRVVLLAPAVSAEYDVRPGLRAIKDGLHVHCSPHDYVILGFATNLLGTPDHRWTAMAGRKGFACAVAEPKLIQRPWRAADCALGNNGGHFGGYQPQFLREHVIPMLAP